MKLLISITVLALTGCAGTHTDSLVFSQTQPVTGHSYNSTFASHGGHGIRASTIHTGSGSYQLISNGSTVTFNQVSRGKR